MNQPTFQDNEGNDYTTEDLEFTKEIAEKDVARNVKLQRLMKNQDFIDLVLEEYLKDESINLVHRCSYTQDEKQLKFLQNGMIGISEFRKHIGAIEAKATQAKAQIEEIDQILSGEYEDVH